MVVQKLTKWYPEFRIQDADGNDVLKIRGPCCMLCACICDTNFQVFNLDDECIGKVSRQVSAESMLKDYVGVNSETFGISFPIDLDIKIKAVLLAACFLIDFQYFER